jgi:hypothetical protein
MPVVKLTPDMLKRMVLEEKKKMEGSNLDKSKLKDLEMDMDEGDWSAAPPHAKKRTHATANKVNQDGNGAGDVEGYKTLKKLEESLELRLAQVREQRTALRRKILSRK